MIRRSFGGAYYRYGTYVVIQQIRSEDSFYELLLRLSFTIDVRILSRSAPDDVLLPKIPHAIVILDPDLQLVWIQSFEFGSIRFCFYY